MRASESTTPARAPAAVRHAADARVARGGLWQAADAYERFMGTWSRQVAARFLDALDLPAGLRWVDVGCGTGAMTVEILRRCAPRAVVGIDPSPPFLRAAAGAAPAGAPVRFQRGEAERLPLVDAAVDVTVSGLALNFTADPARAVEEMVRVTCGGGTVAAYLWDYEHPGFFLHRFWAAVAAVDGRRARDDERGRWSVCSPAGMTGLVEGAGLRRARVWTIALETLFPSADALWEGFLLGVGPSGAWTARLDTAGHARLRARLGSSLPTTRDGQVRLTARAIAMAGVVA